MPCLKFDTTQRCSLCGDGYYIKDMKAKKPIIEEWCDGCQNLFADKVIKRYEYYKNNNIKLNFWRKWNLSEINRVAYKKYEDEIWMKNHKEKIEKNRERAANSI